MAKKHINAWAIITPGGEIKLSSIRESKLLCIGSFLLFHKKTMPSPWDEWKGLGFRCVKVKVKNNVKKRSNSKR